MEVRCRKSEVGSRKEEETIQYEFHKFDICHPASNILFTRGLRNSLTGSIDIVGVLLALAVLLWIPIHILTFAMRYAKDYNLAKVPTFPALYGEERTRLVLAMSTILTGLAMMLAVLLNGVRGPYLLASILSVVVLIVLAVLCSAFPTPKRNFLLFKAASIYMLASMLLVGLAG
jgi:protoheme IX farnesyltransferase